MISRAATATTWNCAKHANLSAIGQCQEGFIPPNHLPQADQHYLAFVPLWRVAAWICQLPPSSL
ncbi:hypothetical protein EB815_00240 [Mesorhizobium loti]|uniref:Uncharacterized protein n=1 Tax=Rhizobium loti TaxID=381 RepID=A0A6M7TSA8_RHILI|nr:hypothetical protein ASE05_09690 [Mesorhizobium sp. Root172]OBQ64632.1 hypothetical protein A8145_10050 [Mesorhizobium loti]QKC67715.1 hypothetical protein EB815_00240 [Mesorhizobium loti]QKC87041.1 hypothetical protein EB230_00240 [Mesorhizobium sp. NZP2234]